MEFSKFVIVIYYTFIAGKRNEKKLGEVDLNLLRNMQFIFSISSFDKLHYFYPNNLTKNQAAPAATPPTATI